MVRKKKISEKGKKIIVISAVVVVALIILSIFVSVRLVLINDINISEFGPLANLDSDSHQTFNDRAILDLDNSHNTDHTTYRIIADNLKVKVAGSAASVSIRITKDGRTNELKQWYLRGGIGSAPLSSYMSVIQGDYYTHFAFQETFDVNAVLGSYYIFSIRIQDDGSNAVSVLEKFFEYESGALPPPIYEMPEVLSDTKEVTYTDSVISVSFSAKNYEHVTSIIGFFTVDGVAIRDETSGGDMGDMLTTSFTHVGDGLFESDYNLQLLPQVDMFLALGVYYADENGDAAYFTVEEFEELLLYVPYYPPAILLDTRLIDFATPVLTISFSVENYEHVNSIIGFFVVDDKVVTDAYNTTIGFSFTTDTFGFYEGEYSFLPFMLEANVSVSLQVLFNDESGQEVSSIYDSFAAVLNGVPYTPTLVTSIPLLAVMLSSVIIGVSVIMIKKIKTKKVINNGKIC